MLKDNNHKYLKATAVVGNPSFNPAERTGTSAKLRESRVCKPFRGRHLAVSHHHRYSVSVGVEKRSPLAGCAELGSAEGRMGLPSGGRAWAEVQRGRGKAHPGGVTSGG